MAGSAAHEDAWFGSDVARVSPRCATIFRGVGTTCLGDQMAQLQLGSVLCLKGLRSETRLGQIQNGGFVVSSAANEHAWSGSDVAHISPQYKTQLDLVLMLF